MRWFGAHAIFVTRYRRGSQTAFPVTENVYLIEAHSPRDAQRKALKIALADNVDDKSLTLNDRPARQEFLGFRKVVEISNPFPRPQSTEKPRHGTEITYSFFEVTSRLINLTGGKSKNLQVVFISYTRIIRPSVRYRA